MKKKVTEMIQCLKTQIQSDSRAISSWFEKVLNMPLPTEKSIGYVELTQCIEEL